MLLTNRMFTLYRLGKGGGVARFLLGPINLPDSLSPPPPPQGLYNIVTTPVLKTV